MVLPYQVCSYDIAIELKKRGIVQDVNLFHYIPHEAILGRFKLDRLTNAQRVATNLTGTQITSAFTVAELLNMLPRTLTTADSKTYIFNMMGTKGGGWSLFYIWEDADPDETETTVDENGNMNKSGLVLFDKRLVGSFLPDGLGNWLIKLIDENILPVSVINKHMLSS